jgi:hypothetical protein
MVQPSINPQELLFFTELINIYLHNNGLPNLKLVYCEGFCCFLVGYKCLHFFKLFNMHFYKESYRIFWFRELLTLKASSVHLHSEEYFPSFSIKNPRVFSITVLKISMPSTCLIIPRLKNQIPQISKDIVSSNSEVLWYKAWMIFPNFQVACRSNNVYQCRVREILDANIGSIARNPDLN